MLQSRTNAVFEGERVTSGLCECYCDISEHIPGYWSLCHNVPIPAVDVCPSPAPFPRRIKNSRAAISEPNFRAHWWGEKPCPRSEKSALSGQVLGVS